MVSTYISKINLQAKAFNHIRLSKDFFLCYRDVRIAGVLGVPTLNIVNSVLLSNAGIFISLFTFLITADYIVWVNIYSLNCTLKGIFLNDL